VNTLNPRPSSKGWFLRAIAVIILAFFLASVSGAPAFATGTYKTLSAANLRSAPSTSATIIQVLGKGQSITIDCYLNGTSVAGTTIWDHLTTGGYISDSLLLTFSANPVVPSCAATAPSPPIVAPPSCNGSSCDGRNPGSTNCTQDATTIQSTYAVVAGGKKGVLELRYSPKCYSNWVRFTPTGGLVGLFGDLTGGIVNSTPYIWRLGVANSLRGFGGRSGTTTWTWMVTAAGTTCSSVELSATENSTYGGGGTYPLGTYNAPCVP